MKYPEIIDAVLSLVPNANVVICGNDVQWIDGDEGKPTDIEIQQELKKLRDYFDATEYQRKRAQEYPSITDYLDGIVKNDTVQIQMYIDSCLAVKSKYPKP